MASTITLADIDAAPLDVLNALVPKLQAVARLAELRRQAAHAAASGMTAAAVADFTRTADDFKTNAYLPAVVTI